MKKTITLKNCRDKVNETMKNGDLNPSQGAAWKVVNLFCNENGMKSSKTRCGIEDVINFIQNKINKSKHLKP